MAKDKDKQQSGGEFEVERTYTQAEIDQMSDAQVLQLASQHNLEAGTREDAVAALQSAGIVIHG